ncbi:RNA-binding S4 domain-containing protein, partial [Streptococcus vicugnae]|uniref:RNA-binding S4 domain-containing protein n=1 Tax=Streptococcus vicugnae TaxID=2740579 RepID=UPI00201E70C5
MRLDKYLKVSRIIKRRPVAKEVADKGRIKVNGILAKSSTDLKINDEVEIRFGNKLLTVRVLEMKDSAIDKKGSFPTPKTWEEMKENLYRVFTELSDADTKGVAIS